MRALRHFVLGAVGVALLACDKAEETAKTVTPRSTDLDLISAERDLR